MHVPESMGADLGRLLEVEQALAGRTDAARHEAYALVEAARRDAEALAGASAVALSSARQELADDEERSVAAELARLEEETAARLARLGAVDEARVEALADQLLRSLLAGGRG